jgi:hypothetical protein
MMSHLSRSKAWEKPVDVIEVDNQYYILAKSSMADDRTRVLKHGDAFAVFDRYATFSPSAWASRASISAVPGFSRD